MALAKARRTQALVQPADLFAMLADWCGLQATERATSTAGRSLMPLIEGSREMVRDRACYFAATDDWAVATPAWYMLQRGQELAEGRRAGRAATDECQLFVKPDDRFEVNDVADRCGDCLPLLRESFDQFRQACQNADSTDLPPLPEILISGIE